MNTSQVYEHARACWFVCSTLVSIISRIFNWEIICRTRFGALCVCLTQNRLPDKMVSPRMPKQSTSHRSNNSIDQREKRTRRMRWGSAVQGRDSKMCNATTTNLFQSDLSLVDATNAATVIQRAIKSHNADGSERKKMKFECWTRPLIVSCVGKCICDCAWVWLVCVCVFVYMRLCATIGMCRPVENSNEKKTKPKMSSSK